MGVGKGDMSPGNSHAENFFGFLVNTLLQLLLVYVFSLPPDSHQGYSPGPH